jgi:uncharacterized membrane protein
VTALDGLALGLFIVAWTGFGWISDGNRAWSRESLTRLMNRHRAMWIRNAMRRDLRMIDTNIIAGLQNGTAFFASTAILAIGGCFALLGQTDQVLALYEDLPFPVDGGRAAFELKVCGLTVIFGYAFFKFGWSYRLFNYGSILFGAIPMTDRIKEDEAAAGRLAERAIMMNVLAGKSFNAGLRAIFLSIGYLGWFVGPVVFMVTTVTVLTVLVRRQFFSPARDILIDPPAPAH